MHIPGLDGECPPHFLEGEPGGIMNTVFLSPFGGEEKGNWGRRNEKKEEEEKNWRRGSGRKM
jgi:hypothetical protein